MSDLIVYPGQISFDGRPQRNPPRRRVTVKNVAMAARKVSLDLPDPGFFGVFDTYGQELEGAAQIKMLANSETYIYVSKRSMITDVPEAALVLESGKSSFTIKLKPTKEAPLSGRSSKKADIKEIIQSLTDSSSEEEIPPEYEEEEVPVRVEPEVYTVTEQEFDWYDSDAFDDVDRPGFSFSVEQAQYEDDAVFCLDDECYDAYGRPNAIH